jgi:alanyl-tRNA synthetase
MAPKQTVIDIDEEKLKSLLEKLEARIPPKPKQGMTLREVIMKSKAMINLALKRGYTYEEIAAILTEEGISIKGATLKQYLTESKSKRSKTTSQTKPAVEPTTATAKLSSSPDTKAEADTNLDIESDIKTTKKADNKQDTSSKVKSKSVVRGKFADIPSNDEL